MLGQLSELSVSLDSRVDDPSDHDVKLTNGSPPQLPHMSLRKPLITYFGTFINSLLLQDSAQFAARAATARLKVG